MTDVLARTPLRVRLVVLTLVLVALALVATGVAGTTSLHGYLVQRLDDQLAQTVQRAAIDCSGRGPDGGGNGPAQLTAYYRQCLNDAGAPVGPSVLTTSNANQSPPALPTPGSEADALPIGKPFYLGAQNGGSGWRVLIAFPHDDHGGIRPPPPVLVALSLDEVDRTVAKQVVIEAGVGAGVLALLAAIAYLLVRSSLRPLVAVERTAEAIAAGDLTRRVPEADPRTEVGGLAQALNVMLGQIETAFDQQRTSEEAARTSEARMRRFVADASHELRTPLTSIRGFAELYRQNGGVDPNVTRIIGRIEHHATRMGVLVDDLLLLARLDQQRPLERRPVDLLALATDAVIDARVTAPDHVLRLRAASGGDDEDIEPAVVLGDEVRLRQVLGNLIANALTHTPAGTEVTVFVRAEDGWAILEVVDNGPGMSQADAARVFERFYRTDPSRTRAAGGAGLGLSIVAALVAAHGGDVSVFTAEGQGATFRVRLPLAD
jgi:two-component system OmpR family sensor kinase